LWRAAIFYSISSCHEGLRSVPLGNALIDRVVDELAQAIPALDIVATLSPVSGFQSWLSMLASAPMNTVGATAADALAAVDRLDWHADRRLACELRRRLVPLCAHYLLNVRRNGEPVDSVARFHLRNGARLERINWLSDRSPSGMRRSAGLMVNYLYRRRVPRGWFDASANARRVTASHQVARLAARSGLPPGPTSQIIE
jgi:malonyl-CoA decarboxylase